MNAKLALVHDRSAPPLKLEHLSEVAGEPRVSHRRLAEYLGYEELHKLAHLIERNLPELKSYGEVPSTVDETTPKGGRPGRTSWLNEGQALVLCALSRTPRAAAVRKQVIDVFIAYRAGRLVPTAPAALPVEPAHDMVMVPADILARLADALDQLAAAPRPADRPAAGSVPPADRDAAELAILDGFLAAHVRPAPGGRLPVAELYQTYVAWCRVDGREPLTDTRLGRLLRHRLERLDGTSRPAYLDVVLSATAGLPAPAHAAPTRDTPALPKPRRLPAALGHAALPRPEPEPGKGVMLYGVAAIAHRLGLTERQAKHRVATGLIPTFKVGRACCTTVDALDGWLAEQLRAGRTAR